MPKQPSKTAYELPVVRCVAAARLNLLSTPNQILTMRAKKTPAPPFRGLAYFLVAGARLFENIDLYAEPFPLVA